MTTPTNLRTSVGHHHRQTSARRTQPFLELSFTRTILNESRSMQPEEIETEKIFSFHISAALPICHRSSSINNNVGNVDHDQEIRRRTSVVSDQGEINEVDHELVTKFGAAFFKKLFTYRHIQNNHKLSRDRNRAQRGIKLHLSCFAVFLWLHNHQTKSLLVITINLTYLVYYLVVLLVVILCF